MSIHQLKKGLDLPIEGAPDARLEDAAMPTEVALIGDDYVGLKPKMLVAEGDLVRRGDPLFCHKDSPEVVITSPFTGNVKAINRGARRVLQSVVVEISDAADPGVDFGALAGESRGPEELSLAPREDVANKLLTSGLWTAFRTRPYSKMPNAGDVPAAIFVTAMDTEPLTADAQTIIEAASEDFNVGLVALSRLTDGKTFVCQAPGGSLVTSQLERVEVHEFTGPHPAGLAGTHMHFILPPSSTNVVWSIGYQHVVAIGRLMRTGYIDPERTIAICGPRAAQPRHLRTVTGAAMASLIDGEISGDAPVRVISGSVLSGREASGPFGYLGAFTRQVTLITEDPEQITLGWITPQPSKFAVQPVLASGILRRAGKLFDLTSNLNGGRRAMVPTGTFEELMPQDFLPTQLLRALLVMDTDTAQALGALELDEEDVALCAFACPAKYEYGQALRDSLTKIEKEG